MKPQIISFFFLFTLLPYFPLPASEMYKREVPNFEGREAPPPTLTEKLLWVPRVVFFPAYVVTEYGFHLPLRWLGRQAELNNVPFLVADFFKFGEENKYAIYPSVLVDFGFRASFGLRFRWKNFLTENNRLNIRAATGGADYGIIQISDEWLTSEKTTLKVGGEIGRRPDYIFHASGPMSSKEDRYRYAVVKKQGGAEIKWEKLLGGTLRIENNIRSLDFYNSDCCGDQGVDSGIAKGIFTSPSRYQGGYSSIQQKMDMNWGRRVSRPTKKIGGIVDSTLQHSYDFSGGGWWIYGGAVTGFFDINGKSRVVSLKLEAESSKGHGGKTVPFNELPALGGERLPGFLDRRFIGDSVLALTMEYKWPVISALDGVVHLALGNVFGPDLQGFQWSILRKSVGIGIEATGENSSPFGVLFALGSQPFIWGGKFDEIRFSLKVGGAL